MTKTMKLFRIDPDLDVALKALAKAEHEPESAIIRRALREYLAERPAAWPQPAAKAERKRATKGGRKK